MPKMPMYVGKSEVGDAATVLTPIAILLVLLSVVDQKAAADAALPVTGLSPVR